MPAKKMTPQQSAKVTELRTVHSKLITSKDSIRAEIQAAYENRLRDLELQESRLMNECKQIQVPMKRIAEAIGTGNWDTLQRKLALTAEMFKETMRPAALTVTVPLEPRPETTKLSVHLFASFTVNWHEFGSDYVEGPYKVDVYRWLDSLTGKPDHWLVVDEYPENKATPIGEYLWNLQYEIRAGDRSKRAVVADWEAYLKNEFEELVKADAKRKAGL